MKKITATLIFILTFNIVYSDTYIKLTGNIPSTIYIDGEAIGVYEDLPVEFILPTGEYNLELKKDIDEDSYYYYQKFVKAGKFDIKMPINASLSKVYSEKYYFKNAATVEGANEYLKLFPKGQYADRVNEFLDFEHYKNTESLEGAKEYIEKFPQGKYINKIYANIFNIPSIIMYSEKDSLFKMLAIYDNSGNVTKVELYEYNGSIPSVSKVYEVNPDNKETLKKELLSSNGITYHYGYSDYKLQEDKTVTLIKDGNNDFEKSFIDGFFYKNIKTIEDAKKYLVDHPSSKYTSKALLDLRTMYEVEILDTNDPEVIREYITWFPNEEYAIKLSNELK